MRAIIPFTIALLLIASPLFARTIRIPQEYPTIQQGITAAVNGDSVLVDSGVYVETINFQGKLIVVKSLRGPAVTIIDPYIAGPVVSFSQREGRGAVIEGFTITNTDTGTHPDAVGVKCDEGSAPVIRGNIIIGNGNYWLSVGGGIIANHANPLIIGNRIAENRAVYNGAGICAMYCDDIVIRDNEILDNYCGSGYGFARGGGIFIGGSHAEVERNLIVDNVADPNFGWGGGVSVQDTGYVVIRNNTFYGNDGKTAYLDGNPMQGQLTVRFYNNVVMNTLSGGGLEVISVSSLYHDFNDYWNNLPVNLIGASAGEYDIFQDPAFVTGPRHSFYLSENSPCIDAGSFLNGLDPDGTRLDIGASPFNQRSVNVAVVPDYWPVIVQPQGLSLTAYLKNNTPSSAVFDVWVEAMLPNGQVVGPIQLREGLSFHPGQSINRRITQIVPGSAPPGNYLYIVSTGDYATQTVYHQTRMPFTKPAAGEGGGNWEDLRWEEDEEGLSIQHSAFSILYVSPNPFNASTDVSFELQSASHIKLAVYDIAGRKVAVLARGRFDSGRYNFEFEGGSLPSGIYFCRLKTDTQVQILKLALIK